MTRLVLVRHGESEWNAQRRIQGQGGTGLSALGHAQAQATADALARLYGDASVVSSDLQRCVETAAPVAAAFATTMRTDVGLRERDFGTWSGLMVTDVAERDPARWERWIAGEDVVAEVGGEDTPTLVARVVATLERLSEEADRDTVVCVTHGGPVWHGTQALLGVSAVLGGVSNCSITEIEHAPQRVRLLSWNQVAHLPDGPEGTAPPRSSSTSDDQHPPPVGT